jgi:DNA mismatch repair protein MutS2
MNYWEITKLEFNKILEKISFYSLSDEGKERILNLIPDTNKEKIKKNHYLLTELTTFFINEEHLSLNKIYNFNGELKKVRKSVNLTGPKIHEIAVSTKTYFNLKKRFYNDKYSHLKTFLTIDKLKDEFYNEILKYIDHEGFVESNATKELSEIRNKISATEDRIKKATNDFYREAKNLNYIAEDIVSMRDGFSCVAIKSNYRNRVDGIVLDSSATGQTVFIVPKRVVEFHNNLVALKNEENDEIQRIFAHYTSKIFDNIDNLFIIDAELVDFDELYSKTRYCQENGYVSPKIVDSRMVRITNGRHPFLGKDAVPLNLEIGSQFHILVITGPNTGGKTVVLKTIGLFILMVQTGIGINANPDSQFPIFDNVYVDIGDEQSIEQSLSTFSAHIKKIISIIKYATANSFVGIDELGAGTDPAEGSALGISILKHLKKTGVTSVITTHYSALKHFATNEDNVANASMEFDLENLKPTYRLLVGIPGSSRALEISSRLGMPSFILEDAKKNLNEDYLDSEKMISKLIEERKRLEEYNNELLEKELSIKDKEERFYERRTKLDDKETELKKVQKNMEFVFLNEARKEFEKIIKEVRTGGASKETILSGKDFFKNFEEKITKVNEPEVEINKNKTFSIGDTVLIISSNMKGVVLGKTNIENEYLVQVGIVKLNIKSNELQFVEVKQEHKIPEKSVVTYVPSSKEMTLDLRGYRYDDAEKRLDKFVESALAGKIAFIKIIHGKGSGALRKCIRDYFENSPFIEDFDYEQDSNKGTNFGITVARIRQ